MPALTFSVPQARLTEYLAALGRRDGLRDADDNPRAATQAEGKEWLTKQVTAVVLRDRELRQPDIDRTFDFGT